MRLPRLSPVFLTLLSCACVTIDPAAVRREADLRAADSRALHGALAHRDAGLRAEAAAAMGRTQSKLYAPALRRALRDASPEVRLQAAFALGQLWIDDPTAAPPEAVADLVPAMADASSKVRAAAVEAMSKLGAPDAELGIARLLADWSPAVRRESATGLFRLRFLERIDRYADETVKALADAFVDPDPDTRWRAVQAFTRWPEPGAAAALRGAVGDESATVRLFALRALAQLEAAAPAEAAQEALSDADARVRVEALGVLRAAKRSDLVGERVLADPSPHARAAAADALAGPRGDAGLLDKLLADPLPFVHGQAAVALARRDGDAAQERLAGLASAESWWTRAKVCEAAAFLPKRGRELLEGCLKDKDVRVQAAGLSALAERPGAEIDTIVASALADPKSPLELRGTAASAAAKRKTAELLPSLRKAYDHSQGREWVEVRESIAEAAAALAGSGAKAPGLSEFRELLLRDPAWSVRSKAAKSLGQEEPPRTPEGRTASPFLEKELGPEPLVTLETEKGDVLIELIPENAASHAGSFVHLARSGFYDGLPFHRVVSNFVVQGGDPRGSGWGDPGYSLRDEITPLKFMRGTVGMAKAGRDTGGSQLFIMLAPAPHLDGRYTAFGRVAAGMGVVDKLLPGDRILKARVK
ncbi:MAG: peptidylprolyl isomerase [Elusimicrobia bacterium]|nr:peptidylprolyl isomerase [Elusimicrobiota bacterium]